jgi:hypothetical protein
MSDDAASPKVLLRVPGEMEAALVVSALAEHGLQAKAVGGYITGFRAEAPGDVAVLVRAEELQEAQRILRELRQQPSDIDWSQVDVGAPE